MDKKTFVRAAFGRTGDQSEYVRTTWECRSKKQGGQNADQELYNDRAGGPVRR